MILTSGFVRDSLAGMAKVIAPQFDVKKHIHKVSTDSRSIAPGDLFVALKGDVFDGHDYIAQAVGRGACGVICEKYPADTRQEGVDIYLVESSLTAYRTLARHWRERLDPTVVGVAGSVGKTTTKDILAALLSGKWADVPKTKGSQNGFIGLPMTLLDIKPDHEVAVVEIGIDAPDAMASHIDIVRPEIAIVTAISEEHLEWLIDLETVAREENLILRETAAAGGTAVINLDDPWIKPLMQEIKSHTKIGFTMTGIPGPNVLSGRVSQDGQLLEISGLGRKGFNLKMPLPGEHNARNLLGAVACALIMGVTVDELEEGIENFASSGGRSELERTKSGTHVLCDFYNANPASMRAAFRVAATHRKSDATLWLCLGDMKELGTQEETLHRGLAKDISALGAKIEVLLHGERTSWLADELKKINFQGHVATCASHEDLVAHLSKKLRPEDFVMIKGSRSMRMEKVWQGIKDL